MELILNREKDKSVGVVFLTLEGLCAITLLFAAFRRKLNYVGLCLSSMLLLFAPTLLERLFRVHIRPGMKKVLMIYAVAGPVGGNVYQLYFTIPFWDKILHILCGVLFAMLGYSLPDLLEPEHEHSSASRCISAVCVAMTIGVLWEIYEFCGDTFFGLDMQNDTVISGFSSYLLSDTVGERGAVSEISSVVINGQELGVGGYIDIGLRDTMLDLIMCLFGSIGVCCATKFSKKPIPPMIERVCTEKTRL